MHNHNTFWYRLQHHVTQLTAEHPDLARAIERGTQTVALGGVEQDGWNAWTVSDPGERHVCRVMFHLNWSCSCQVTRETSPVTEFCGGVQPVCHHVTAAALFWATGGQVVTLPVRPDVQVVTAGHSWGG